MSTKNDITGDNIVSKASNDAYRNNKFWDKVDANKAKLQERVCELPQQAESEEAESEK